MRGKASLKREWAESGPYRTGESCAKGVLDRRQSRQKRSGQEPPWNVPVTKSVGRLENSGETGETREAGGGSQGETSAASAAAPNHGEVHKRNRWGQNTNVSGHESLRLPLSNVSNMHLLPVSRSGRLPVVSGRKRGDVTDLPFRVANIRRFTEHC